MGRSPAARPRVLLAEDEEILRDMLRDVLRFRGFDVRVAEDGDECLWMVREECPDLVVLDIMMPKRDGYDTAAQLRADPATAKLPILALTALASPDVQERALRAGCDLVLTKPVAPNALVQAIHFLLEKNDGPTGDAGEADRLASAARTAADELVARGAEAIRDLSEGQPTRSDADLRRRIQGMDSVPACSFCHRVRAPDERWREIPEELREYFDQWTSTSHGVCPECFAREYPDLPPQAK
ncbi:MAG: response regulator [Gemmatimonadetes bacterium]|nr:response regulator [Gemmatimonadota bacterium]